jgi:hypothetical protein
MELLLKIPLFWYEALFIVKWIKKFSEEFAESIFRVLGGK